MRGSLYSWNYKIGVKSSAYTIKKTLDSGRQWHDNTCFASGQVCWRHWLIVFEPVIFAHGYHHIFPSRLTVRTQHLYIIIKENQLYTSSHTYSLYEKLQRNRTSSFQSHKHRLTNTSQITTKFNSTFIDKVFVDPVSWIRSNIHKLEYTLQITFEIYYSNEADGQV